MILLLLYAINLDSLGRIHTAVVPIFPIFTFRLKIYCLGVVSGITHIRSSWSVPMNGLYLVQPENLSFSNKKIELPSFSNLTRGKPNIDADI